MTRALRLALAVLLISPGPLAAQEDHSGLTRAKYVQNCLMCHNRAAPDGLSPDILAQAPDGETSEQVAERVARARQRQLNRQGCVNAVLDEDNRRAFKNSLAQIDVITHTWPRALPRSTLASIAQPERWKTARGQPRIWSD